MLDILISMRPQASAPMADVILDDQLARGGRHLARSSVPLVLNTCLALRHAIWRKGRSRMAGLRRTGHAYVDQALTSPAIHLDQVAALCTPGRVFCHRPAAGAPAMVERLFGHSKY